MRSILHRFLSIIKASPFWKSVMILSSGVVIAQVIGVITTPVVSRLYTPTEFGQFALFSSTSGIVAVMSGFGLISSIMTAKSDEEGKYFFTATFWITTISAAVFSIGLYAISPIKRFVDLDNGYALSCVMVFLYATSMNVVGMLSIYANKLRMNKTLFIIPLINSLATLCITIPLGFFKVGTIGLIVAAIIANVISIVQLLHTTKPVIRLNSNRSIWGMIKKNKEFVLYQYWAELITTLSTQIPTQFLSNQFGSAKLGAYSMSEKVLGIPSRVVGAPINTVYFRTANELKDDVDKLRKFTFRLVIRIMLVALVFICVTVLWGEKIFAFVLGKEWAEAGKLAVFLIPQYTFMICYTCTSYCRVVIGRQRMNLLLSIIKLLVVVVTLCLGVTIWGTPFETIICFSIGTSLFLVLDMTVNFICMGKYAVKYVCFSLVYIAIIALMWIFTKAFG